MVPGQLAERRIAHDLPRARRGDRGDGAEAARGVLGREPHRRRLVLQQLANDLLGDVAESRRRAHAAMLELCLAPAGEVLRAAIRCQDPVRTVQPSANSSKDPAHGPGAGGPGRGPTARAQERGPTGPAQGPRRMAKWLDPKRWGRGGPQGSEGSQCATAPPGTLRRAGMPSAVWQGFSVIF